MMVSDLKRGNSRRESYITVMWTPSLSQQQQGPNILCYNATDSSGWGIIDNTELYRQQLLLSYIDFLIKEIFHCMHHNVCYYNSYRKSCQHADTVLYHIIIIYSIPRTYVRTILNLIESVSKSETGAKWQSIPYNFYEQCTIPL